MVRLLVAVRPERHVDDTVAQQQRRTLVLAQRIERYLTAHRSGSGSRNAGLDHDRTAELLGTRSNIQGVQSLDIVRPARNLLRLGHDVESPGRWINDRRPGNSDFASNIAAFAGIVGRNSRHSGRRIDEARLPQRRRALSIGVERVDAVVLRRGIDDISETDPGNVHVGDIQCRRVHRAIQLPGEQLAEDRRIDGSRRQDGLVEVRARAEIVVVMREFSSIGRDVDRCIGRLRQVRARCRHRVHAGDCSAACTARQS